MNIFKRLLQASALAFALVLSVHAAPRVVTGSITTQNLVAAGDATAGSAVEIDVQGVGTVTVQTTGTYTGALSGQVTTDGATWITLGSASTFTRLSTGVAAATITSGQQDIYQVSSIVGAKRFRVTGLAAMTGTASITVQTVELSVGSSSGGGGGGAITAASGSYASGAFAAGSLAAGAGVDGWSVPQGAKADAVCGTDTGTCSEIALLKKTNANLTTLAGSNAQLPTALGATTAVGSLSVVSATDATNIVAQGSTTSGQKGGLIQGAVTTSAPSYTTAQTSPLSLDTAGNLRVSGSFAALDAGALTGTCAAACLNTTLTSWDTTGYQSSEIQFTAVSGSTTLSFQCSSDNTTWFQCNAMSPGATGSSGVALGSATATGIFCLPVYTKFQRVQITGWSSGTETMVGYQRSKSGCGGFVGNINSQATIATTAQGPNAQGGAVGNPLNIGVEARTSAPTATTNAQITRITGTVYGAPVVKQFSIPELDWTYAAATGGIAATTTAVTVQSAAGAGIRHYVTGLCLQTATLGNATEFAIRDGASGTVIWRTQLQTTALPLTCHHFATPLKGTAATLLEIVTLSSATGGVFANLQGYDAP